MIRAPALEPNDGIFSCLHSASQSLSAGSVSRHGGPCLIKLGMYSGAELLERRICCLHNVMYIKRALYSDTAAPAELHSSSRCIAGPSHIPRCSRREVTVHVTCCFVSRVSCGVSTESILPSCVTSHVCATGATKELDRSQSFTTARRTATYATLVAYGWCV